MHPSTQSRLLRLLTPTLRSPTTLHPLSRWSVDMVCRDPTLVIRLRTRSHSWPISSNDRHLVRGVNFLRLTRGSLGSLASFTAAALLGEERCDPGAVDEVACSSKGRTEEEIEEDAWRILVLLRGERADVLTFAGQRCSCLARQY